MARLARNITKTAPFDAWALRPRARSREGKTQVRLPARLSCRYRPNDFRPGIFSERRIPARDRTGRSRFHDLGNCRSRFFGGDDASPRSAGALSRKPLLPFEA